MNDQPIPEKRPRGRPRKNPAVERDVKREPIKHKMRAAPNWETVDPTADDSPDRLKINPDLIPEGMSALWVTDSVMGQSFHHHRSDFEKKGWTPVHQDDFDGQFNGMWMKRGDEGEINVGGLVLMMRPKQLTDKARKEDRRRAHEQVQIKEQAWRSGDLPGVSLDAQHPNAVKANRISRSIERITIPED